MMRLVGLADIVLGVTAPTNDLHARLQRLPVVVPAPWRLDEDAISSSG